MKFRNNTPLRFINVNTGNCKACWKCMENCPNKVFGKIDFLGHRHIKASHPEKCTGCLKCVMVCVYDAITKI
jgi:NAD-dependent dihydropyrimidine dehydrogenase PreA subunit